MHHPPLPPKWNIPGIHFCYRLSRSQGHSAAGRIMSMKNSNDIIGNRTRDLPACSAVPQPTALRRAPDIVQRDSTTSIKIKNQNYTRSKTFFLMLCLFFMLCCETIQSFKLSKIFYYRLYPTRLIWLHVGAWGFLTGAKAVGEWSWSLN